MNLVVVNKRLKYYAVFSAVVTFLLVCMGGLVTSHGAGLAVPDWPNTYGYNMFFFPISKWMGGIFYEHVHRLLASAVGFLTIILALWLFGRSSRPLLRRGGMVLMAAGLICCLALPAAHRGESILLLALGAAAWLAGRVWPDCPPAPRWLRVLGVAAFFAVVLQGVLGGLRVIELKDQIGIFHAALAQLFFCLMCSIALFQTDFWRELPAQPQPGAHHVRTFFAAGAILIFLQLVLGATMRHQHAGLSIPDFPAAYGRLWPKTDPASIQYYNQSRIEASAYKPITAFQVELQMVHRLLALTIFGAVGFILLHTRRCLGAKHLLSRLAAAWFGLIVVQIFLGAATIWTDKSADIATAHVACGALCLMTGALSTIISFRILGAPCLEIRPAQKNELTSLLASSSMSAK